jgi:hypothetical protein
MERQGASVCRPRACLRVGVTGHRTGPKLEAHQQPAVRATIARLFEAIATNFHKAVDGAHWAFGPGLPELVVVSALAEGADRIVAQEGLEAGAVLDAVLPANQGAYEKDFESEKSKLEFRDLLGQARSVFQLAAPDGALKEKRGYQAAGWTMLAHADLLIAVWDEAEGAGIGGTAEIVEQAFADGAPILLINPATPSEAHLLWTGPMEPPSTGARVEEAPRKEAFAEIPKLVQALVAPPADRTTDDGLRAFYTEPPGPEHGWPLYSALLAILAVRRLKRTDFIPTDEHPYSTASWHERFPDVGKPLSDVVCSTLLPSITLPDRLAVRYAELYRSAFVFNFLSAALAVILALAGLSTELPAFHGHPKAAMSLKFWLVLSEVLLLLSIVGVWLWGAHRAWHRRWLDYRRAAEWLRYLRVLCLVGARAPIARPRPTPSARTEGGRGARLDQDDWVGWYVRAIGRLLPFPAVEVDAHNYVEAVRNAVIVAELDEQIKYHHANRERMAYAALRLHWAGLLLFSAPIAVGAIFIVGYFAFMRFGAAWAHDYRFWIVAGTAAFPALGAAFNAIRVQADFETLAIRSEDTAARLATIREAMQKDAPEFIRLSDLIRRAVAAMGAEHSEWRTLFGTRPLSLPA